MHIPTITDDLNPELWGDSEIIADINDAEIASEVALEAIKAMNAGKHEETPETEIWNTVVSRRKTAKTVKTTKTAKTTKTEKTEKTAKTLKCDILIQQDILRGVITKITKGNGYIDTNGKSFMFSNNANKFNVGDSVSFVVSTSKSSQSQRFKRAIKIKRIPN